MYEPPIEIVQHTIRDDIDKHIDDCVYKAVVRTDIHVDREELIKALQYDRDQFQKGFAAGVEWAGPKWISVEDRLPTGMSNVLMYIYGRGVMIGYYQPIDDLWSYDGWSPVTHWMPLPKAPKEDVKRGKAD